MSSAEIDNLGDLIKAVSLHDSLVSSNLSPIKGPEREKIDVSLDTSVLNFSLSEEALFEDSTVFTLDPENATDAPKASTTSNTTDAPNASTTSNTTDAPKASTVADFVEKEISHSGNATTSNASNASNASTVVDLVEKEISHSEDETAASDASTVITSVIYEPSTDNSVDRDVASEAPIDPVWSKWVVRLDFSNLVSLQKYFGKDNFVKVANVSLDNDTILTTSKSGARKAGLKKRQTLIRFNPIIEDWKKIQEWIYLFLIDGYIVKIGGTSVGLDERGRSYLSGHYIPEKGGKSNSTNAFIYSTLYWYLLQGKIIEMYGYRLPEVIVPMTCFGVTKNISCKTFDKWEAHCFKQFEEKHGKDKLPLSSNYNPRA